MGKLYTSFQTKTAQKPTRQSGTYLYGLYKGVPPPPGQKHWPLQLFSPVGALEEKKMTVTLVGFQAILDP